MLSFAHYPILPLLAAAAVGLDYLLGEARRYHPLVGFGWLAYQLEARLNAASRRTYVTHRLAGVAGVGLLLVPFTALAFWLCSLPYIGPVVDILLLYFAVGHKSLHEHARAVVDALRSGNAAEAREAAARMVSRDSSALDPVPATVESVLENGNDGVFGALFWFFIAGGAGALAFRLANTLDAMWGYRSTRFLQFGWAAARLDDVLDYLPARLTALTYAALGKTPDALTCWRTQAPTWDSPNAGPVMAAGAGALGVRLGGPARYQGEWHARPPLGTVRAPEVSDIERALALVRHGVYLWLALPILLAVLLELVRHA